MRIQANLAYTLYVSLKSRKTRTTRILEQLNKSALAEQVFQILEHVGEGYFGSNNVWNNFGEGGREGGEHTLGSKMWGATLARVSDKMVRSRGKSSTFLNTRGRAACRASLSFLFSPPPTSSFGAFSFSFSLHAFRSVYDVRQELKSPFAPSCLFKLK